jgi:hypothetical protein
MNDSENEANEADLIQDYHDFLENRKVPDMIERPEFDKEETAMKSEEKRYSP